MHKTKRRKMEQERGAGNNGVDRKEVKTVAELWHSGEGFGSLGARLAWGELGNRRRGSWGLNRRKKGRKSSC